MNPAGRRLTATELTDRRPDPAQLEALPRTPMIGILENIRSLWNVGSMFRTADALRLEALMLCGYTAHPPRAEIHKTALGACDTVPWQYWSRAADAIAWLRNSGYRIVAFEHTTHSLPIVSAELSAPLAFVVGNEVTGVSDAVLELVDAAVEIPMLGTKESLNVAVAFGVGAFALRERVAGASDG